MLHEFNAEGFIEFSQPPAEQRPSHWLIGICAGGHEYATCRRIEEERPIGIYLPFKVVQRRAGRNRVVDVVRPLLQPYFFVPASIADDDYHHIISTPGVFDLLQIDGKLAVIRDGELDRTRLEERKAEEKRRRRILEQGKGKHFMVGEPVSVDIGFTSIEAIVHKVGRKKIEVDLGAGVTLFGRQVVPVDLTHLKRRANFSEE